MLDEAALPQNLDESVIDDLDFIRLVEVDWVVELVTTVKILGPKGV